MIENKLIQLNQPMDADPTEENPVGTQNNNQEEAKENSQPTSSLQALVPSAQHATVFSS
jgi:hypothetical protein